MARIKMTQKQVDEALKLLKQGYTPKQLAEKYGVHRSVIYRRVKQPNVAKDIPVETKNKVIKAIKKGHTKAEAAQMYGLNIGTVYNFTKGIAEGHRSQGNHVIRKNGIKLLNRLMTDGYLITGYNVPVVRNLQRKFPIIRSARYKEKTFFYLHGREDETVEAFFFEMPDRIISYYTIEELSYLLGVKFSRKTTMTLVRKYKGKHKSYWKSRHLIQTSLKNWIDDNPFLEYAEPRFALLPKKGEW